MLKIFHGNNPESHDSYQAWRRSHPDGFNLTEKSGNVFVAHWSQDKRENSFGRGCIHQGGSGNAYLDDKGACYTTKKKVCSDSLPELLDWAQKNHVSVKNCMHCDTRHFPFPTENATPKAYLFLWNPKEDKNSFKDFDQVLSDAQAGRAYKTPWICPSKQPLEGDLAFIQRTGPADNGIFARGYVTRGAHMVRGTQKVELSLEAFLPIGQELTRQTIVDQANYEQPWMPMSSGNRLPAEILQAMELLWRDATPHIENETSSEELQGLEGRALERMVVHRRRERLLRERKVQEVLKRTGKLACEVPGCGFDFAKAYGENGAGYAHVHHLTPLSERDGDQVTTLADLAIVCANCHAIVHRGGECRDLTNLIRR